jgi:hypothetical protein
MMEPEHQFIGNRFHELALRQAGRWAVSLIGREAIFHERGE